MRLFSFRIRAISTFIFDTGMSTRRCRDPQALRIRVNMSAIGSVMLMRWFLLASRIRRRGRVCVFPQLSAIGRRLEAWAYSRRPSAAGSAPALPACLSDARNHPRQGQLPEADSAQAEPAQERARPAAPAAAIVLPHGELRLPLALLDHGL